MTEKHIKLDDVFLDIYWYSPAVHPLNFGRAKWCYHNQSVHHSAADFSSHVCCSLEGSTESVESLHSNHLKTTHIIKVLQISLPLTPWQKEVMHILLTSNMLMCTEKDLCFQVQTKSHHSEHSEREFLTVQVKWFKDISKIINSFWWPILNTLTKSGIL